tara:strand:- start:126 stop:1940 length:1815 start_codon:yes stop_codon:yes gene_type:complete
MPTARFHNESSYGFTIYDGSPDQKITFTTFPYDWLEASVFYTNIQNKPYPGFEYQSYKDKGFNFKVRLKKEGDLPSLAIGFNDFAGTGLYSSEYIVSSYGVNNFDFHIGLGWGALNNEKDLKNPLSFFDNRFNNRPLDYSGPGGEINYKKFFRGDVSSFYGLSYAHNEKLIFKLEKDTTSMDGLIEFPNPKSDLSLGMDLNLSKNFSLGFSLERGNSFSLRFSYKNDEDSKQKYKYKKIDERRVSENKYINLKTNLEENGIGVKEIVETADSVGLTIRQFAHPSLEVIEEIIYAAKNSSGIEKDIYTNYEIVNLDVQSSYDNESFQGKTVYKAPRTRGLKYSNNIKFRPFLASREEFFKGAILFENDSEYLFNDNLSFSTNLKLSLWNNFDDLIIPPVDTYPAQVRSDVKDYLRGFDDGIVIGRAQFDYFKTISKNNHVMVTAGILEEMFSGYGFEYLWFNSNKNYSFGFEVFNVYKRDYELNFGRLDYENITGHLNFYYRNYSLVPFDAKFSYGEYLAGDVGSTIELSRTFNSGIRFGIFASKTNVTSQEFGEGSFDKGIFFNIPIFGEKINYSWRPLTKDPAQKLVRKNNLFNLLVRFKDVD